MAKKKTSSEPVEKKEGLPDVKVLSAHEIKVVEKLEIKVNGSTRIVPKVEHEVIRSSGELRSIYKSEYDHNGNKTEMAKIDSQGNQICSWGYEWKPVEKDKQVIWYQSKVRTYGPGGNSLWEAEFGENGTLLGAQALNPHYAFDIETKTIIDTKDYSRRLNQRIKQAYFSLQKKDPDHKLLSLLDVNHEQIFFISGIRETYSLSGRDEKELTDLNDATKLCEAYLCDLKEAVEKKVDLPSGLPEQKP